MDILRKKPIKKRPPPQLIDPHHRRPQSLGGRTEPRNISTVPINKHRAWHLLFKNYSPQVIAKLINKIWLDPSYEMVVVRKEKFRSF